MKKALISICGIVLAFVLTGATAFAQSDGTCQSGNCVNGKGTKEFSNGGIYTGQFVNGKRHGQGSQKWPNGDSYNGAWANGKTNGMGTYTWANGDSYTGMTRDGKAYGQGTKKFANGDSYTGAWADDRYNGYRVERLNDNQDVYEGQFKDGERHGRGKLTCPYGLLPPGPRVKRLPNGRLMLEGIWENGEFVEK